MACSYPITIKRLDQTNLVPCGRCIECIQRKRAEWSFRLLQESKQAVYQTFLTLTYDEKIISKDKKLQKSELQKYFKRVRHKAPELKYYAVGEYGGKTNRPHYHAIVFNTPNDILVDKWSRTDKTDRTPYGFVTTDNVSEASIHYVTGYVNTKYGNYDEKTGKQIPKETVDENTGEITNWSLDTIRPFSIMSKGLGKIYLKHNEKLHKSRFKLDTTTEGGRNVLLPRYYRNLLFPKDEVGIRLGLVSENQSHLNTLKLYMLDKYEPLDYQAEIQKREYRKQLLNNNLKNKKL